MAYSDTPISIGSYPNPNIDPRNKNYEWVIQYCRAAYKDSRGWMPFGQTIVGNLKMSEIKMYRMGKQPIDKYKKAFSPDNPTDESWRAVDWTPPAFMSKYVEIAVSKLLQKKFNYSAFAVDPMAKSQEDAIFNQMKVKMLMRQQAQAANSPLANSPVIAQSPNEPQDMEELMMAKNYGYKHEMATETDNAINLVFYQNQYDQIRRYLIDCLYDYGIGGITQCLDENGMVKLRCVNPEYLGLSYCEKSDFSDLIHWFEIVPTWVGDLAPYYDKDQLDKICKSVLSKNGNPNNYIPVTGLFNPAWNRFKVFVLKIKFLSWNDTVYKEEVDKKSNVRFGKSSYANKQFLSVNKKGELQNDSEEATTTNDNEEILPAITGEQKGSATPKYINSSRKVRYKASWIIDTNFMHDWGLDDNQNRKLSSWWDTDLDIQLYAWNFHKMQFSGITERLIPIEDQACMTWYQLQNLSNKLIPYLINLDMNAIEGAFPYGKSGNKGKPSQIIDFIFSNFVVPFRSTDILSRNPNYKPVSIEATGQLQVFGQLYEKLQTLQMMMQQISGLNELTDGSTPNQDTLVPVANAAIQSTNNAIYLISAAEKSVLLRTADAIIQKVQIAVQIGKVEGYATALGTNMVQFFSINPRMALHEFGIFIDEAPTDEQRAALWQDVSLKESQGLLTVGDKYFIMTCRNLNEAVQILDYKIQKRKDEQQQNQLQMVQQQAMTTQQGQAQLEQLKQQTIQIQLQADLQRLNVQGQWQYITEMMKKQADVHGESIQADARTIGHQIQASAKVEAAQVAAGSHVVGKHIDREAGKEIQEIANQKPQSKS